MGTDSQKTLQKVFKTQTSKKKSDIHTTSKADLKKPTIWFFSFWLRILVKIVAILLSGVILGLVSSPNLGYILSIGILILWISYHFIQMQKITSWIKNTKTIENINIHTYPINDIYGEILSLIVRATRSTSTQQSLLNNKLAAFKRATEAMTDGVVIIDNEQRIVVATPIAERYLNIKSEADCGKNIVNIIRNYSFAKYLKNKDWSKSIILENLPIEDRVLELRILPYDEKERLIICKDITKLKRLETSKKDFVANVSHELKTPLTILKGYIETMIELPLENNKKQQMLNEMYHQTQRMKRLVDDLLILSKLDGEESSAKFNEISITDVFARMENNASSVSRKKHNLIFNIESSFNILGVEDSIFSAFFNLVYNAINYTEPGGQIKVSWYVNDQKKGIFIVEDNGVGIEAHHLPFVSDRFYRVDKSRTQKSGGTGLGLSIVKNIALKHEAKLEIESKVGFGSKFYIIFPKERVKEISETYEKNIIQ
ncbi:MAG: phosphate regulon sensor histidine kinase PhoR [Betaproteobacteria bacterium TMED156]|nr:MAG: phosphate regulon sensor histidine kinase PhoR [Betaproteobacteria bacterium TMED156]